MFTCGVCSFKTVKRDNFLAHVAEHSKGEGKKRQPVSPASVSKTEEPPPALAIIQETRTAMALALDVAAAQTLPAVNLVVSTPDLSSIVLIQRAMVS
ncbi:hypothetical protein E2C01_059008 [Portunus trituberculatus]|uniref:C2H2-type domain-containing protein n=1 Tax=Portunus trituberculatus TaxID=210409 RepID=A0A5B7H4P2_PORTR|nr:hypothetical protein [Portunus trituberculatus]